MRQPIPFGKYLLLDRIAIGGMAEIFVAKAFGVEGFERILAIKKILPNMVEDGEFTSMFVDEARIAVQLNHANIAQIYELGRHEESLYIALEYVSGRDLRALMDRCRRQSVRLTVPQACYVAGAMLEGLDYAHRKKDAQGRPLGIVHRDVSPQNILVSFEGEVKVVDFGIAKAAIRNQATQAGVLKGKFGYMSPEQVRGQPIDARSDLFAAGVVLYELLTAEKLFTAESDFSTLEKVRNADVPPPRVHNEAIPPELERIVLKALAREPADRYQSASDLHEELSGFALADGGRPFGRKHMATLVRDLFAEELRREAEALARWAATPLPESMLTGRMKVTPAPGEAPPPLPNITAAHPVPGELAEMKTEQWRVEVDQDTLATPAGAVPAPAFQAAPEEDDVADAPPARKRALYDTRPDVVEEAEAEDLEEAEPKAAKPLAEAVEEVSEGDIVGRQKGETSGRRLKPNERTPRPAPPPGRGDGTDDDDLEDQPTSMKQRPRTPLLATGVVAAVVLVAVLAWAMFPVSQGTLIIQVTPDQALLTIDGESAQLPFVGKLATGPHRIFATAAGYEDLEKTVNVSGRRTKLRLELKPSGDEKAPEATAVTSEATAKEAPAPAPPPPPPPPPSEPKKVRPAVAEKPVVKADKREKVVAAVPAEDESAVLLLESDPAGAEAKVDGRSVGPTPARVIGLSSKGRYKVSLELDGYSPARGAVNMAGRLEASLKLSLNQRAAPSADAAPTAPPAADAVAAPVKAAGNGGFLIAASKPPAMVIVDQKPTNRWTPIAPTKPLPLTAGPHTITFRTADGETRDAQVMIRAGETAKLIQQF